MHQKSGNRLSAYATKLFLTAIVDGIFKLLPFDRMVLNIFYYTFILHHILHILWISLLTLCKQRTAEKILGSPFLLSMLSQLVLHLEVIVIVVIFPFVAALDISEVFMKIHILMLHLKQARRDI